VREGGRAKRNRERGGEWRERVRESRGRGRGRREKIEEVTE
jgi:hypothetical protein